VRLWPWHEPTQKTRPITDRDRERDEAGEPRESHRPGRRRRAPRAAAARRPEPPARPAGCFESLGLLEELELGSVVVGAHSPRKPTRREGQSRPGRQSPLGMGEAAPALAGIELVLNRYRPLRPLGSGGSGSVWLGPRRAHGPRRRAQIVAREGKSAARAEREAKTAAHLRHPACLRAYGFGRDSRHVYIAYEYVPGQTYREALRAGALTDDGAIEACAQVCDGLAHAHAAGILHRDVKPSTSLLADGDRGIGARARLRARADGRRRDADRGRRRPRNARVHLARAASRAARRRRQPTSGQSA